MKNFRPIGILAFALVLATWIYFLTAVNTFDFDESLYRRVAEEMKFSGDPWHLTWDHRALYHKPPIFYWLIWMFSIVVDGLHAPVSSLAARLPGFFSSIGILITLFFGAEKMVGIPRKSSSAAEQLSDVGASNYSAGHVSMLAFIAAIFPVITATGVIFDPLQTLCLMPSLLIPAKLFYQEKELSPKDWFLWAFSLFLASSVKGLNGLILPSFAFGLHLLFYLSTWGRNKVFEIAIRFLAFVFLPAAIFTVGFYFLLDQKIGPAFTQEFIWVQHLGRTNAAMENHSGSVFYHPLVIFLGGGFLIGLITELTRKASISFRNFGFPLTYAFSFLLAFSFSATKLPHYTWPVWPALALACGILSQNQKALPSDERITMSTRLLRALSTLPVFILGIGLLLLLNLKDILLSAFPAHPIISSMAPFIPELSAHERGLINAGAVTCFFFFIRKNKYLKNFQTAACLAAFVSFCLTLAIGRTANEMMTIPYQEIAADLWATHPAPTDCIRYSGAQSPTLSLALGEEITHNNCEPATLKYLISPIWKAKECDEKGLARVSQKSYLVLCQKK